MIEYEVRPGSEIRAVADRLREVDRRLPARLRTELRKAAKPAAQAAKQAARSLPARGVRGGTRSSPHRPKQLRRQLARGVRVQASAGGRRGAGLRIVTAMPTAGQAALPRGMDAGTAGFAHPMFGRSGTFVRQEGGSWFREPIAREAPNVHRRVQGVLDETAQWIADAGA